MAKRKYTVPILKPEHCTREYMANNGLGDRAFPCYAWGGLVFGAEGLMDNRFHTARVESGWLWVESPREAADAFNAAILRIDPNAKPTGKPFPMPKRRKP